MTRDQGPMGASGAGHLGPIGMCVPPHGVGVGEQGQEWTAGGRGGSNGGARTGPPEHLYGDFCGVLVLSSYVTGLKPLCRLVEMQRPWKAQS